MSSSDVSTWATVAAVVVALGLGVVPPAVKWLRRPVLELRFGDVEPFVRPARTRGLIGPQGADPLGPQEIRLRLGVENAGKSEARRVRLQVTRWWSRAGDQNYEWAPGDIDPMTYPWVGAPPADGDAGAAVFTDLAAGGLDYVEIAWYQISQCKLWLTAPDRRERPFRLDTTHSLAEQRLEVVAGAENAALVRKVIAFDVSQAQWITNVRLSEPPPADATLPAGLLGILRARVSRPH